ncbi:DUF5819 family protein [Streptomyces sp. NPDC088785]|uniref:DUF5819 family protein n=1 Tax=Streptomyces sp. NPDC088785 TaxID=3365897 RepID=UPI003827E10A
MKTEAGAAGEAGRPAPEPPGGAPDDAPGGARDASAPQTGRQGLAALPPAYRVAASLALAGIAVVACVHVLMVFLHVAPSNTMSKRHGEAVDRWVYPEFEQNWKLFAPNPLQQNIAVQARAEVRDATGTARTTDWYDLSAQDGAAIRGNLLPSHTTQNELRRAWDVYLGSHDAQNRSTSLRGMLSEQYLRRILVLRFDRLGVAGRDGVIERVQIRSRSVTIAPPKWSDEKVNQKPVYRVLSWWKVTSRDAPLDSGAHVRAQDPTDGAR